MHNEIASLTHLSLGEDLPPEMSSSGQIEKPQLSFLSIKPPKTPLRIIVVAALFLHKLLLETPNRRCCFLPVNKEAAAS